MSRYRAWDSGRAREIAAAMAGMPGPLLPMLHRLQAEFGYIHAEAVPLLAELLNLSRAEVHGVVTFYHDFRLAPPGLHSIEICRAESCQSMQADGLLKHATERLGIAPGGTTADGTVSLREVFCLGHCAASPAATVDGQPFGRLTVRRLDELLDGLAGAA